MKEINLTAATQEVTFDPIKGVGYQQFIIMDLFNDTLVSLRPDGQIEGRIAKSWSTKENEIHFTINENAKFHDGSIIDAESVKHSFCKHINSASLFKNSLLLLLTSPTKDPCDAIQTVGKNKIVFKLKGFYPSFFELIGKAGFSIIPKNFDATKPIGSGPFKIEGNFSPHKIVLVRNSNYHGTKPKIDKFNITTFLDPYKSLDLIDNNSVDVVLGAPVESIENLKNSNYSATPSNTLTITNLFFNLKSPALKSREQRLHLYQWLLKTIFEKEKLFTPLDKLSYNLLPEGVLSKSYYRARDWQKINNSLKKIKIENREQKALKVIFPRGLFKQDFISQLSSSITELGYGIEIVQEKGRAFLEPIISEKFDLAFVPFLGISSDPDSFLELFSPKGILGPINISSSTLFSELEGVRFESNREKRIAKYEEAITKFENSLAVAPVAQQNLPIIIKKNIKADGFQYYFHIDLRNLDKEN